MNISAEQLFTALSHPIRLRCLALLHQEGELCVCELTYALEESQPKISRHLAHLREWGLVQDRRQGLWIHYRIHPELPAWAQTIVRSTFDALNEQVPYSADRQKLQSMPNRPDAACGV